MDSAKQIRLSKVLAAAHLLDAWLKASEAQGFQWLASQLVEALEMQPLPFTCVEK